MLLTGNFTQQAPDSRRESMLQGLVDIILILINFQNANCKGSSQNIDIKHKTLLNNRREINHVSYKEKALGNIVQCSTSGLWKLTRSTCLYRLL